MAEWWTQHPEPKWGPKEPEQEERHSSYVNGPPVQKSEQEMEPLSRNGVPGEENEMYMKEKAVFCSFFFLRGWWLWMDIL